MGSFFSFYLKQELYNYKSQFLILLDIIVPAKAPILLATASQTSGCLFMVNNPCKISTKAPRTTADRNKKNRFFVIPIFL